MSPTNAYIIFEPDQVLTNDHLNEMFDYLDTQERLTRNKLIGIGIVCGLEVDSQPASINISKGCGVTSKGYLIVYNDSVLTQYISYTLPSDPLYKPFIKESTSKQYDLWRLLTNDEAKAIEGVKQPVVPAFIKDKVVVLFLEANEVDLKNCDTQDCNEKGRQMNLTVRPLLIGRTDMEEIIAKQKKLSGDDSLSDSYIERLGLKEVGLKRFDVKASPLADAYDIYNAYIKCLDDATLQNVADVYSQCYSIFKPILPDYSSANPFKNLQAELKSKLEFVKKSMPVYIQYYYDFIDDLIKAYQEFKESSFEVITECCPDEDQFPMHIMLGEAAVDTKDFIRTPYRQYFISSPLFNNQADLLNEVQLLFERMVNLVKNLFITQFNQRVGVPIRITPSKWSSAPLSVRSIPYYYNINNVARSWNAVKTKKGKSNTNLSYNADKYSIAPPDTVLNPLQYSIEPYNFYRIEGHIGLEYTQVLNTILSNRNSNRLPFDVIALKAGSDASDTAIKYDCHFEDLEMQFAILKAELACKMHEPVCLAAKIPTTFQLVNTGGANTFNFIELYGTTHTLALTDIVDRRNLVQTTFVQNFRFARKGDFLKTYCPVKDGTLGNDYLKATNRFFPRPAKIDLNTSTGSRAALMHMIDITESLMQTITGSSNIYNFNYANFNRIYDQVISYFTDFMTALLSADAQNRRISPFLYGTLEAIVSSCIDEKLKAITDEYTKRVEKIQKQNLLSEFLKTNPGIDHKAGVPRGGTFIIVYHEKPAVNVTATSNTIAALTDVAATATGNTVAGATTKALAETSAITGDNMAKLLKLFESNDLKLTAAQANTLKQLTLQNFAAATVRGQFVIQDRSVVADFYLPYLCCSDCPPIAYILPKQQAEALSIKLDKTDFCNNDEGVYKITVSPQGGTLSASAGGVDAEKFEFRPKGVTAGIIKITYTLPDNRTASVDVKITAAFEVDFKFEQPASDPFSFHFIPSGTNGKIVSWNFGDGTAASTEQSPVHKYVVSDATQVFTVTLTVTDGPCIIKKEQVVTISKPQTFSISPSIFCSNDDDTKVFAADPAIANISDIANPNGLKLQKDEVGNIFFVPLNQGIQQTTDYQLSYKGASVNIKVVAAFEIDFKTEPVATDGFSRRFIPVNTQNREVIWDFGDGSPLSKEQSPLHTYAVGDNQGSFKVTLTATDEPCQAIVMHEVVVSQPKPAVFSLDGKVFCSKDKTPKVFVTEPAVEDIGTIINSNNLQMEKNSTGKLFFIPSNQDIGKTTDYTLTYNDINVNLTIIVPAADFTMNVVVSNVRITVVPPTLILKAKQDGADDYRWRITSVTGASFDFEGKQVTINLLQLGVNAGTQLTIFCTVSFKNQTGVNCQDTKEYVLTEAIFRNHVNKGEFDNVTPS